MPIKIGSQERLRTADTRGRSGGKEKSKKEKTKVKKIFGIALVLAVVASLCLGTVALADGPTEVHVTWSGTGSEGITVTAGDDAVITFSTSGTGINGTFTAKDWNDNPYSYNVDTVQSYIDADVTNGYIEYETDRNDSGYGNAGQGSYSYVWVFGEDSWGAMAMGSWTNYAALKDCTYGKPHTANGYNFEAADATYYELIHYIGSGPPPPFGLNVSDAYVYAEGEGLAQLHCLSSMSTVNKTYSTPPYTYNTSLGCGCGCDNCNAWMASFHAEGSGNFDAYGEGSNQVTSDLNYYGTPFGTGITVTGDGTPGSASLQIIATWVGGTCDVQNYSMKSY